MGTINGCGTMFYGWRFGRAGGPTATRWLTLFYFPLLPLARFRLTPTTAFDREKFVNSPQELAAALVGYGSRTDTYRVSGRVGLDAAEALTTYAKAYLALPLLMLWPLLLLLAVTRLAGPHPEWEDQAWFTPAMVAFAALALMNAVAVPMWAIQSARGYRGGLFRRRS